MEVKEKGMGESTGAMKQEGICSQGKKGHRHDGILMMNDG